MYVHVRFSTQSRESEAGDDALNSLDDEQLCIQSDY